MSSRADAKNDKSLIGKCHNCGNYGSLGSFCYDCEDSGFIFEYLNTVEGGEAKKGRKVERKTNRKSKKK